MVKRVGLGRLSRCRVLEWRRGLGIVDCLKAVLGVIAFVIVGYESMFATMTCATERRERSACGNRK